MSDWAATVVLMVSLEQEMITGQFKISRFTFTVSSEGETARAEGGAEPLVVAQM